MIDRYLSDEQKKNKKTFQNCFVCVHAKLFRFLLLRKKTIKIKFTKYNKKNSGLMKFAFVDLNI